MTREVFSEQETRALAAEMAGQAKPGEVYALTGGLGVGKTAFTKGFAEGLHIKDMVNSPTFTILQEYEGGRLPLYHFDVYRIEEAEELFEVGFEEYLNGDGVSLVEWADLVPELMPPETRWIVMEKDFARGEDYRRITVKDPA